jgi:hypothetical protein
MLPVGPVADRAAKTHACDELLKSRTLARSEQLIQFLRYICELELDGRGAEISEYSIATNALHRPADYAPGDDSSVRSRAHALRRKLDEYYENEAPDAELRVELPKGSYRPLFAVRNTALTNTAPAVQLEPTALPIKPIPIKWRTLPISVLGMVAAIALTAVITMLVARRFPPDPIDPVLREAWGPVLQPNNDVLILIGAPPVARAIPSQPGVRPHGNVLQPAPAWVEAWYSGLHLENRGGPLFMFPTRGYTVFSDLLAAMSTASLIGAAGGSYHTAPEPAVEPRAIHENGLVIIGAPTYLVYASRILKNTPYSIWFDAAQNEEVVGERAAGAGGHNFLARRNPQTSRYTTVYGLITVLPSQPGGPNPERTLIFSGIMGSPGAQAAIDFFRSPTAMRDLKARFRREGYMRFPAAYQVVVRCGVDVETAINAVYETHRIMAAPPLIE